MKIQVKTTDGLQLYNLGKVLGKGETAIVYEASLDNGSPFLQTDIAIKVAKDKSFNSYIEREHLVLQELHSSHSAGATNLPSILGIAQTSDGRKALVLKPILKQSLLQLISQTKNQIEREMIILDAAAQYGNLLKLITESNKSCQDKKLLDFWWVREQTRGKLVVTDWNIVNESKNQLLDIRRFGLLWYELVVGKQMKKGLFPSREDYEIVRDRVSYGLWYLVGRCISDSMGAQILSVDELIELINKLSSFYSKSPKELEREAASDIATVKVELNRQKADIAWIKLDLAEKLGSKVLTKQIQKTKLWAINPLEQYAPTILDDLASPQFSTKVSLQLDDLYSHAHGDNEKGDIARLQFIFEFLKLSMKMMLREAEVLSASRQQFSSLQKKTIELVRHLINQEKGLPLSKEINEIKSLLPEDEQVHTRFLSIAREIQFWDIYKSLTIDSTENDYEKAKELRKSIAYLPESYIPSIETVEQYRSSSQSHKKITYLKNDQYINSKVIDRSYKDRMFPFFVDELDRWQEFVSELIYLKRTYPDDKEIQEDFQNVLDVLNTEDIKISNDRKTFKNLNAREKVLQKLLDVTQELDDEFERIAKIKQHLEDVSNAKEKIINARESLFDAPLSVINKAIMEDFEIFDPPGLSAATLKTICESGYWDKEKLDNEVHTITDSSNNLKEISSVLKENIDELHDLQQRYETWDLDLQTSADNFFLKTLRLYLASAWTSLENGEKAENFLLKANAIINSCPSLHENTEYQRYRDFYEYLLTLQNTNQDMDELNANCEEIQNQTSDNEFQKWFTTRKIEKIKANYHYILDDQKKSFWEMILEEEKMFSGAKRVLDNPSAFLDPYKRSDRPVILSRTLDTLLKLSENPDGIYNHEHYKEEIETYYSLAWSYLNKLKKKQAQNYKPYLGVDEA